MQKHPNILIIAAHPRELQVIKRACKELNMTAVTFSFCCSGIGMENMIYALTETLTENSYDIVMNIGVAGYIPGKKIDPQTNLYYQISDCRHMYTNKELVVPMYKKILPLTRCLCSPHPITDPSMIDAYVSQDGVLVDMESRSVEFVCAKLGIPRVIYKTLADNIGEETQNFDHQSALDILEGFPYEQAIGSMLTIHEKQQKSQATLQNQNTYKIIRDHFSFTHAQWQLLLPKLHGFTVLQTEQTLAQWRKKYHEETQGIYANVSDQDPRRAKELFLASFDEIYQKLQHLSNE